MKGAPRLRQVFHHREDRIRAHVQLCWLALLLIRVLENATGQTWRNISRELDECTWSPWPLPTAKSPNARPPHPDRRPFEALDLTEPPRFFDFTILTAN